MRINRTILCGLMLVGGITGTAHAATLSGIQGEVIVVRGGDFQTVKGAALLVVGDLVVVRPGGEAQITYDDGCTIRPAVGGHTKITAQSPCAARASLPKPYGLGVQANPITTGAAGDIVAGQAPGAGGGAGGGVAGGGVAGGGAAGGGVAGGGVAGGAAAGGGLLGGLSVGTVALAAGGALVVGGIAAKVISDQQKAASP